MRWAAPACLVSTFLPAVALATPVAATLDVRSPRESTCADRERLVTAVQTRLGRNPFVAQGGGVAVQVRFRRERGWTAVVRLESRDGHELGSREISVDSDACEALVDPVALVVAMLVDVSEEELPAARSPVVEPAAKRAERPPRPRRLRIPPPPPATASHVLIAAGMGAGAGLLPRVAPGASLGLWLSPNPWVALGVSVGGWLPQREEVRATAGADLRAVTVGVDLCGPRWGLGDSWARACVLQRASLVSASAYGFAQRVDQTRPVLGSGVGGHWFIPLHGSFGGFVGAEVEANWQRDRFVRRRSDATSAEVYQPSLFSGHVQAGVALSFGGS